MPTGCMPCDAEASAYIREIISIHKDHLKTVFCYGRPEGDDIDICVVCDRPEAVAPAGPPIDQKVLNDEQFKDSLKLHRSEIKEFRIYYGNKYVLKTLNELGIEDVELYDLVP